MGVFKVDERPIEAIVIRSEENNGLFRWELRESDRGMPLQSGQETYSSVREARQAGEGALAAMRAQTEPNPAQRRAELTASALLVLD